MRENAGARTALVVTLCLAFAGVAAWSLSSREVEQGAAGVPDAVELDSLSRYLAPVAPAPRLDDYAVFLPARRPARFAPEPEPAQEPPASSWELSAIMIAGVRPVAIINDEAFVAGARLPDGAVVLQIERDHVVIRAPNGTRRRLVLSAG